MRPVRASRSRTRVSASGLFVESRALPWTMPKADSGVPGRTLGVERWIAARAAARPAAVAVDGGGCWADAVITRAVRVRLVSKMRCILVLFYFQTYRPQFKR